VFTIPKGLFEPTIMFFTLTNYLVTFQTIMNEILWDLINTREVVSSIDNNNLYVKPEKCKWKIRKVGFLRIVMGSKRIKIKEEKMKGILEWPTPKGVKYIQKLLRTIQLLLVVH